MCGGSSIKKWFKKYELKKNSFPLPSIAIALKKKQSCLKKKKKRQKLLCCLFYFGEKHKIFIQLWSGKCSYRHHKFLLSGFFNLCAKISIIDMNMCMISWHIFSIVSSCSECIYDQCYSHVVRPSRFVWLRLHVQFNLMTGCDYRKKCHVTALLGVEWCNYQ